MKIVRKTPLDLRGKIEKNYKRQNGVNHRKLSIDHTPKQLNKSKRKESEKHKESKAARKGETKQIEQKRENEANKVEYANMAKLE